MRYILILILLFVTNIAEAGISVCSDVSGNITRFELRGNEIPGCLYFDGGTNVSQVEYDRVKSLLNNNPKKYIKVSSGQVVIKTLTERQQSDADEDQAIKNLQIQAVNNLQVSADDLITALIQVINDRLAVNKITKQEIIDKIKLNKGL